MHVLFLKQNPVNPICGIANMTLDVADEKQTGDAIQLQLAVHAAFGNAKGKGKFGQKGKPGKGKLVRSHLTIEQRLAAAG